MLPASEQTPPAPAPPGAAAIQARQDHLFRHHDHDDPNAWATMLLRRYVGAYRLQRSMDGLPDGQPGVTP